MICFKFFSKQGPAANPNANDERDKNDNIDLNNRKDNENPF